MDRSIGIDLDLKDQRHIIEPAQGGRGGL